MPNGTAKAYSARFLRWTPRDLQANILARSHRAQLASFPSQGRPVGSVPEGDPFVDESWLDCDEARTAALASIPVGWQPTQPHPTPSPTGTATHGPDQLLTRPKNDVRSAQTAPHTGDRCRERFSRDRPHPLLWERDAAAAQPHRPRAATLTQPAVAAVPAAASARDVDLWDYHGVNFTLSTERLSPCDWRLYALAARGAWHGVQ